MNKNPSCPALWPALKCDQRSQHRNRYTDYRAYRGYGRNNDLRAAGNNESSEATKKNHAGTRRESLIREDYTPSTLFDIGTAPGSVGQSELESR